MKFSIIIPTLNEHGTITDCLLALQAWRDRCEIIVADASSDQGYIPAPLADKIIACPKGRARQMNLGAEHAQGDILIFLHADTSLPENALTLIEQGLGRHEWGRFDIRLRGKPFMLHIVAFMMNLRSRFSGIATGDQVIFVKRNAFNAVGRFPDIALMEDIALSKALKKTGPPLCLKAKAISSGRRWEQFGVCKTILLMWRLRLGYFFGEDPQRLAKLYSGGRFWQA